MLRFPNTLVFVFDARLVFDWFAVEFTALTYSLSETDPWPGCFRFKGILGTRAAGCRGFFSLYVDLFVVYYDYSFQLFFFEGEGEILVLLPLNLFSWLRDRFNFIYCSASTFFLSMNYLKDSDFFIYLEFVVWYSTTFDWLMWMFWRTGKGGFWGVVIDGEVEFEMISLLARNPWIGVR